MTSGSHINVAFSRGTGWRGLCPAQTVTDRTVGYNAWLGGHVFVPLNQYAQVATMHATIQTKYKKIAAFDSEIDGV